LVFYIHCGKFKGFVNKEEAVLWLNAGAKYEIKHMSVKDGIYFDAGTGSGQGVEISVTDKNAKSLLDEIMNFNFEPDIQSGSNSFIDEVLNFTASTNKPEIDDNIKSNYGSCAQFKGKLF
jgi:ribonuclease HI